MENRFSNVDISVNVKRMLLNHKNKLLVDLQSLLEEGSIKPTMTVEELICSLIFEINKINLLSTKP